MDVSITGGSSPVAAATAATTVNTSVLHSTQNLSEDLVDRLFSTLGLGSNLSAQG